ncbi:DUF885 domain-containing protein [Wenzhouxiangella sp. XN24]|uniref:DUF885 domain-containing protein n=1 Tax=Wenzhouxiangella sp. XN24 TaxID=2713569 RepID=UPI0013ECA6A8|nr:DUF885 domain-containing protein [Wenzhouxiangella sp. XN24]NGX16484.1 DUF885 domain-containing protein [Wenzhouxiangella sp. XN24]
MHRILVLLTALGLLAGCATGPRSVDAGAAEPVAAEPVVADPVAAEETLHAFFARVYDERRAASPQAMAAATAGTEREADYLGRLDIPSVARTKAEFEMARRHRAELAKFQSAELSPQDRLSLEILAWTLDQKLAGEAFLWHDFPVNQLMAIHNMLPSFMTAQHPLRNDRDLDFYLQRLAQFPAAFAGTVEVVAYRAERGVLPPRFAIEKTLRDAEGFIAGPPETNPLVTEILARADRDGVLTPARRATAEAELAEAVSLHVVPAYRHLASYLEELLPTATSNHGVWALPDGEDYYRWVLRGHTTTELGPTELHALGLAEVARIEGEMDAILCSEGYCEGTVGARMAQLNSEERFLFEDSAAGREAVLEAYREIVAEIGDGLAGWFHDGPAADIEVRRVPEYRQATAFGAYYMRPALDGSRPGMFFVNLRAVNEHPRFGLRTLAYHEAIPGHHLQVSRMQAMSDVPEFRRSLGLHAHAEGWALYAERLAWEMGFHADPYDNLGRLQAELFRAVRLVVDTGMHQLRWSREQGIDYMHAVTGMPMSDVVSEIERYLVIPGQACSFKTGMIRMQAMRERAAGTLGEAFDIRDFHRLILDSGAMPLDLLDAVVDDWISQAANGDPSR